MLGFLRRRQVKVIPWSQKEASTKRGFEADFRDTGDALEVGRRPNVSTVWKVAAFIILVTALALYAKAHWPGMAAVFSLRDGDYVNVVSGQGQDFFIEFRLDREKTEKEQVDLVKKVMDDQNASKEARDAATAQYLSIVDAMGKELKIEGILKAKGWDSLVFLSPDACTVVVKTLGLEAKDVTQIGDVVKRISKIKLENVTVIPVEK